MYGIQQGTAVLKQIHAEMGGIERVGKLMEDNAEARAYQREVSDMLGGQLSNQDEDEVEDELAAMSREVTRPQPEEEPQLPDAPISKIEPSKQQETKVERNSIREERRHAEPLVA